MNARALGKWSIQRQMQHASAWERCRVGMLGPGGSEGYCRNVKRVFLKYGLKHGLLDALSVRDAACGTGFTTLPLASMTRMSYSDGSQVMVDRFNTWASLRGYCAHAEKIMWQKLPKIPGLSRAILVLGNSLSYASSWAENPSFDGFASRAREGILNALKAFHTKIENGGALLFDLCHEVEQARRVFEVQEAQLVCETGQDTAGKIREWKLTEISSESRESFVLYSLLLPYSEWISMVKGAGFGVVEKIPASFQLEDAYTAFIAFKR